MVSTVNKCSFYTLFSLVKFFFSPNVTGLCTPFTHIYKTNSARKEEKNVLQTHTDDVANIADGSVWKKI